MVYSSNSVLTREQMLVNANYLMNEFTSRGWTKESISGMLGNMEVESWINPGVWQNFNEGNMSGGFGLVQWTPASNYISWANSNGYAIGDINGQIARIIYELENGLQYIPTSNYPLSFREFTQSTQSPEYLASAFLKNYERAGEEVEQLRRSNARYWFETIEGGGGGGRPFFPTVEGAPIKSVYGWRIHPIHGDLRFHSGTDFGAVGTDPPIYATQTGVVIRNEWTNFGGWTFEVRHTGDQYFSRYLHLARQPVLPVGYNITKGEQFGIMGTTGESTGIHLHFEIGLTQSGFGTENGTINPEDYLQMDFGGGIDPPTEANNIIGLLLCDALNGWKY